MTVENVRNAVKQGVLSDMKNDCKKKTVRKRVNLGGKSMNNNLQKQFFKLTRLDSHNNGYLTRRTYRNRMRSYLEWASDRGLQKIQNIKNKAVIDYVNEQLDNGISIKTLQATLSAIRYYNKLACGYKGITSKLTVTNDELGIGGKASHTYREGISKAEFETAMKYANGDIIIEASLLLGYYCGLRSNEIYNLRIYELHQLINSNDHTIEIAHGTKGGKKRIVPISDEGKQALTGLYDRITDYYGKRSRYSKFICGDNTDDCKHALTKWHNWWSRYAERISSEAGSARKTKLSAHSLRRQYARNLFDVLLEQGIDKTTAANDVSEALGHGRGRADITAIYLGFKV